MKRKTFFSIIAITAFTLAFVGSSHAKLDILREVDGLVDASKPNVLLVTATDKFMTRPASDDGTGAVNENKGDDAAINSRFYMVKDVLAGFTETGVLDTTKEVINYGFMAYNQTGYYTYFEADHPHDYYGLSSPYPGGYQGNTASFAGGHNNIPYYFKYYADLGAGNYPSFNASYPLEPAEAGKLLVKIDSSGSLTQNGPRGAADANADEVTVIKKFLALQKDGGLALDDAAASDARVKFSFKNTGDSNDYNDAYDYFANQVIPSDGNSSTGCFTKNYVIYLADGFGANTAFVSAAGYAEELYNLAVVAGTPTPVKTFVIGVLDFDPGSPGNFGQLRENLNEIARRGGTDASDPFYGLEKTAIPATASCKTGTAGCKDYAFFVSDRAQLKEAMLNIAAAIAAGDFVTGAPTATSSGGTFVTNDVGILASSDYPEWRGHLRAVDLVSNRFLWDASNTLFVSAADANLPNAVVNAASSSASFTTDTSGDGINDPPTTIAVGADTYQYTDRVLYCKTGAACNSSNLISYQYVGASVNFKVSGTSTAFSYKGAFYLKPWGSRKVYTSQLTGTLLNFTSANWSAINTLAGWGVAEGYARAIINFALGGVDKNKDGTVESAREWWLGDITNVVPVAVGKPIALEDNLTGRKDFQDLFSSRGQNTVVYAGSNDCMFHAYDFGNGEELFAYIPPDLLQKLKTLYDNAMLSPNPAGYTGQEKNPTNHIYGISTSSKANDVQFADGKWHTVVVSGMGPGGKNYFALDVTHPNGQSDYNGAAWATDKRYDNNTAPFSLLWHTKNTAISGSYSPTLGETWSLPAFGRINDSGTYKWIVFAGSGYDDTDYADAKGEIYHAINIEDGALLRNDVEMDGSGTAVQYGLLADSVSIIKKTGSNARASYQVDLKGRVWHFNTSNSNKLNWTKTQLTKTGVLADPNTGNPFYYSPAIWDYDSESNDAPNLMVLGSGTYDDSENDANSTKFYFAIINPATPQITDAFSVNISTVGGTQVDTSGNTIGTATAGDLANAKLIASPIFFNNRSNGQLQALFLVFDPPAAGTLGCSLGGSYLLVFDLGSPSTFQGTGAETTFDLSAGSAMKNVKEGNAQFIISMGTGKVSGIGVAGGESHVVVGESGRGRGSTSGFNLAGGNTWNPIGQTKKLYWKKTGD
jgi:hypothetical protein